MRQTVIPAAVILACLLYAPALAQDTKYESHEDETCPGPLYERKEVSRPAKFTPPVVDMTDEARAKGKTVVIGVALVLCRTGHVTDVKVMKGSPGGMTERVIEAVRRMKFTPAEKDGQEVSQKVRIEFEFHVF